MGLRPVRADNPQEERLAVLFIDLDDFKKVNDSFDHSTGDELLRVCARRLTERLAAGDTAARLGGDEFAVLLESGGTPEAAAQMARYLLDAIAEPIELHGPRIIVLGVRRHRARHAARAAVRRGDPPQRGHRPVPRQ